MSVKPIFFALDGKELSEFTETLEKLKGVIYGVKVGLEMFTAEGPSSVEKLKNDGWKVFLDLKLHDIPNTVKQNLFFRVERAGSGDRQSFCLQAFFTC